MVIEFLCMINMMLRIWDGRRMCRVGSLLSLELMYKQAIPCGFIPEVDPQGAEIQGSELQRARADFRF